MLSMSLWWLVIQLFGLAALPLTWRLFVRLPGRGYPFAKVVGLLLVSYVLWLGASLHLIPNDLGGIALAVLVVAAISLWLGRAGWQADKDGHRPLLLWLRGHRGLVIATEVLFLGIFAGWAAFRAYNPDIAGTEKPMELAFINGVLRSRLFPPQDPWLSGYGISYYYFGYVMLGVLIQATGVLPEVGFNLGVAMWYALVMVSAFGVGHALVELAGCSKPAPGDNAPRTRSSDRPHHGRGIRYGLLAALLVGVSANLEGVIDTAYQRGLLPLSLIKWLDIKQLTDAAPSGGWTGGFWWWWRASRVIHDKDLLGNSVEVIDEFPFFSFLLGDMHPHVLALPFALLAIGLALNLLLAVRDGVLSGAGENHAPRVARPAQQAASRFTFHVSRLWTFLGNATGLGAPGIILYALALGALGFLNTWDFPIYVGLAALAVGIGLAMRGGLSWGVVGRALAAGAILGILGWLLYLPFYVGFQSQLGGILPNLLFPSRFSQFFIMFGAFLVIAVFFFALLSRGAGTRVLRSALTAAPFMLLLPALLLAVILLGFAVLPSGQAAVQELLNNPSVQANIGQRTVSALAGLVVRLRVATPWTWLVVAGLIAWAAGVLWAKLQRNAGAEEQRAGGAGEQGSGGVEENYSTSQSIDSQSTNLPVTDLFAVLLISLALILAFVPEFVYLRDLFGTRMNTVFKFYYQAWVMLALASAYGLSRLSERETPAWLKAPGLALATLLILGSLWYPLAAIPSKADNFHVIPASGDPRPTLDGLAYLRRDDPAQMAAIEWLRANVLPDAVVVEASGGSYSSAARVSMATGNPTLLGWDFHERQWRGNAGYDKLAAGRPEALDQIYRSARPDELPALLDKWGIDYVFVGTAERAKYGVGDAALVRFDRVLKLVYDRDGVRIYAR